MIIKLIDSIETLQVIGQLITSYGNIILVSKSKSEVFQHFTISENADGNYKANSNIIKLMKMSASSLHTSSGRNASISKVS